MATLANMLASIGVVVALQTAPGSLPPPTWTSSFEHGSQPTEWTYWGQGQEGMFGRPAIVTAASQGIPAQDGTHVVKLYKAPGDPARHHKLYQSWRANTWPSGAGPTTQASSPADVSGSYTCHFYIPSAQLHLGESGWINLAQFKEDFTDPAGGFHSNPDYWFGMNDAAGHPQFNLNSWGLRHHPISFDARPYLDRWFTVELRLYQGDRLELYVDGRLKDIAHQSEFPVGRRYFVGQRDEDGNVIARNEGWTFGAGDYAGTVQQESLVYVDGCSLRPFG